MKMLFFIFDKNFLLNTIIIMKVSISELENSKDLALKIKFEEVIKELNPQVPVKASLDVVSLNKEYVTISGEATAFMLLTCDRCLKEFSKEITVKIDETFIKTRLFEEDKDELELKDGSFIEDLNGVDEIDITDLIYQSVILNIPNKLVCDINCIGDEKIEKYLKKDISDPRLDIFKSIKIEKEKDK